VNDRWPRWAAALAALCLAALAVAQDGPQRLAQIRLNAGIHNINAEVAATPEQREIGLMFRTSMPAGDGMLFVFERPSKQCFWMRNTLIPLSVAFLDDDGSVVNIEDMKPRTLDSHCSTQPVRFVLEMNEGWFAKRGIRAGSRVRGGPFGS
jgi:uncharacterized membrane protein (UPF0127 family)